MGGKLLLLETRQEVSVDEALRGYLSPLKQGTVYTYELVWAQWTEFCKKSNIEIIRATSPDASRYVEELAAHIGHKADGGQCLISRSVIKEYCGILRRLYAHLQSLGLIQSNPFALVYQQYKRSQAGHHMPHKALRLEQYGQLLSLFSPTKNGRRDKAWCLCLFGCGMRLREVENLRVKDFRQEQGTYYFSLDQNKSGNPQKQVIPDYVAEHMKQFFYERIRVDGAKPSDFAFIHYNYRDGTRLSYQYFTRTLRELGLEMGINRLTPHDGRATMVTLAREKGLSVKETMALSRHKSPQMIDLYDKRRFELKDHPGKNFNPFS